MTEFRKDIFTYNNQNQLEMEKLNSFSGANKIEFKPNDGIYVNGTLMSGSGGPPVGNPGSVVMTGISTPPSTTIGGIPLGKTIITFAGGGDVSWIFDTNITINYDPNPSHPYNNIDRFIPLIRTTGTKPNDLANTRINGEFIFDRTAGTFELKIFITQAGGTYPLSSFVIEVDFPYIEFPL